MELRLPDWAGSGCHEKNGWSWFRLLVLVKVWLFQRCLPDLFIGLAPF